MKRIALLLLVANSISVGAATRAHYGGTLRVALRMAPLSLDPASGTAYDSVATRNLTRLLFDRLLALDDRGSAQPALATSWQAEPGNQRWRFNLRKGVMCHDGSALTSDMVAASLRAANSHWKVFPAGDAVIVETDSADSDLPVELTLERYGIAKRLGSKLIGTGPYSISQWDPGKKLALSARDDYWNGRPFVDAIEIEFGKNLRDQNISLDVGKADLVEVAPEQARRAGMENRRIEVSSPVEWMALVFASAAQSPETMRLREALAVSIDRRSLSDVLFQGGAEASGSLLPNWMTGYSFLFPAVADLARARQISSAVHQDSPWILSYDSGDPTARLIAERIALNARDGGVAVQVANSGTADMRLVRVPLASLDDRLALTKLAAATGLPQPKFTGDSIEDIYAAEAGIVNSGRVIPLLHVREAVGVGAGVRNWAQTRDGIWHFEDVWMSAERP
jgi:peptide/nickel transport system substrate-binding protein